MHDYRRQATFHRAALLLGLVSGRDVVTWAHDVIEEASEVPPALLDLVLVPPHDLTGLRRALQPMSDDTESAEVVAALLDLTERDLASGRRSYGDTITILSQVRRFLTVPPDLLDDIDGLVDDFMLASAGVTGDVASVESRLVRWLTTFAGRRDAMLGPRRYHVMECDRTSEAAAFVAALSRFLDSPLAGAVLRGERVVEVWARSVSSNVTTLYLTDGALVAAQLAFAPVPVSGVRAYAGAPTGARRVLDGRQRRAMGVDDAMQQLEHVG